MYFIPEKKVGLHATSCERSGNKALRAFDQTQDQTGILAAALLPVSRKQTFWLLWFPSHRPTSFSTSNLSVDGNKVNKNGNDTRIALGRELCIAGGLGHAAGSALLTDTHLKGAPEKPCCHFGCVFLDLFWALPKTQTYARSFCTE